MGERRRKSQRGRRRGGELEEKEEENEWSKHKNIGGRGDQFFIVHLDSAARTHKKMYDQNLAIIF